MSENIALLLFGLHYAHVECHSKINYNHIIDYRYYIKNIRETLLNNFSNFNIDCYAVTNESNIQDNLINDYNLKNYIIDNNSGKRNYKIRKGLELIINSNIHYKYIIITRFDIYFLRNITQNIIDFDKLNLVSILEHNHLIDDNFYFLPNKYLERFYNIFCECNDSYNEEAHNLIHIFNNHFEVNYLCNEHTFIDNLSFYKLQFYSNIEFKLNYQHFEKNLYYYSKDNNAVLLLYDECVNLNKIKHYTCWWCWFGYVINKGNYKLTFYIFTNNNLNNFNFLKLNNPNKFIRVNKNINNNEWTYVEVQFNVQNDDDLLCFIVDEYHDLINFTIRDIKFYNI